MAENSLKREGAYEKKYGRIPGRVTVVGDLMNDVIGVILCGGYGTALGSVTEEVPTSLVEIREGYTILDKQLFDFKNVGIKKVILVISYLGEKIEERFNTRYNGMKITYVKEEKPEGTLKAIKNVLNTVKKNMVIANGDIVTDINLKKFIDHAKASRFPVTIFITQLPSPYGVVEIESGMITSFVEKPILNNYINAGIYFFKKGFNLPGIYEKGNIGSTAFPELAKQGKIGYYQEDVFWRAIDNLKDLEEIQKEYKKKKDKPWGYEKILIDTDKYLTKELYLKEGYQTSFHLHGKKDETMYILKGRGYIEFEGKREYFSVNDTVRVTPNTPHSIVALENTVIHEVSTPFPDDTTRLRDYYGRV